MVQGLDNYFGVHEQALRVRATRAQLLAQNIANADTPHYKARDIDFSAALANAGQQLNPAHLRVTDAAHIAAPEQRGTVNSKPGRTRSPTACRRTSWHRLRCAGKSGRSTSARREATSRISSARRSSFRPIGSTEALLAS